MTEDQRLIDLKDKLTNALSQSQIDGSEILRLSSLIADLDQTRVRFSVDSGVIDRLGKELVARQETAVSELAKNAYDADATEVQLNFIETNDIGGTLVISDNGQGMTRDEVVNGFMRISSTNKIHNPLSNIFKRKRAGQKGIGRFAVQRLGLGLTIITQRPDLDFALKLTINWNDYTGDADLGTIYNRLIEIPKQKSCGTELIIEKLRDKWSEASIKRIFRYVSDIIQPFVLMPIKKQGEIEKQELQRISDNFTIHFFKTDNSKKKSVADNQKMIYDYAIAEIDGYVDEQGKGMYSITSKKLNLDEIGSISSDPDLEDVPFRHLSEVNFKAYYFIYEPDIIPATQSTTIRKLAQTQGGVRLYRNGFRVLPYGEPSNDWLKLDKSSRQRSILPSHANINFFGFVQLKDDENKFYETSSREGLTENEALIELQNFVYRTLMSGVLKVAELRNIKITSGQEKDEQGVWEKMDLRIKNISHTLEELDQALDGETTSIEVRRKRRKKIQQIQQSITEIAKIQKEELNNFIKEKSMLRVLSAVGLTISQFVHEIKYYLENIQSDIAHLLVVFKNDELALKRVNILKQNFSTFADYTSYFDNVVSQNIIRDLRPLDLRNVVNDFIKSFDNEANPSLNAFVTPLFKRYRLFTRSMHPSEWSSILFNLYTNSIKAIKRKGVIGRILIACGDLDENTLYLEFSDNGDGIPKEIEEKIFDEFFTTTTSQNFENFSISNQISGTGLGLKIVKDILSSYRGKIYVIPAVENYSTTIRIEIQKASEKELEKYGL